MSEKTARRPLNRRAWTQILAALVVVVLDRLMKAWIIERIPGEVVAGSWVRTGENIPLIPGVIHLTQVHNYGASFSILENMRWPLLIVSILLMGVVVLALFAEKMKHATGRWALGLILGGAMGNAIDRALLGYVVDMFEVEFVNFAVFNVADIFITCGAVLFCVYVLFFEGRQSAQQPESFRVVPREEYEAQNRGRDSGKENHDHTDPS